MLKIFAFLGLFFLFFSVSYGQEFPPVTNYEPSEYHGGNQNWMITQSPENHIYVANNKGLLQFDGAKWTLYPSPNETILRSVRSINDRIFSGCYMDFGFWEKDAQNFLSYTSLRETLNVEMLEDEQIWNIVDHNSYILFQSLNRIYIYDTRSEDINTISPSQRIIKLFKAGEVIYFQIEGEGLFTIENGRQKLFNSDPFLKNSRVVDIFNQNNTLNLITAKSGFFSIEENNVIPWSNPANEHLRDLTVYSSSLLADRSIYLGTISNGIVHISNNGELLDKIDQTTTLGDNTVLAMFEDNQGNVWLGLDNGIDCVNNKTPFKNYLDEEGVLGATYTSLQHDDLLYVGTNQGLFYKKENSNESFKFITGTDGQVWSLDLINNQIFCGHDSGTFLIKEKQAIQIGIERGTWKVNTVPGNPNLLIQGNYSGLYVLSKENGLWAIRNKLEGFNNSSKHFELVDNSILVSHEYKGVYKLNIDDKLNKVIDFKKLESVPKGANASLAKFNDHVYYGFKDGIYKYDAQKEEFIKAEVLSNVYDTDEYISGKLVAKGDGQLWMFTTNYVCFATIDQLSGSFVIDKIPIPQSLRKGIEGYEDISYLTDNRYLMGASSGYLIVSLDSEVSKEYPISINKIGVNKLNDSIRYLPLKERGNFDSDENYISFSYSVPSYNKFLITEYQYKLEGLRNNWSTWASESEISFDNLSPGSYEFFVKAKINNKESVNIPSYKFIVEKPFHLSGKAIALYILAFLFLFILLNYFYQLYYKRQRNRLIERNKRELELKELASQKEIIELKNENLKGDIESRNRELAVSTMNMIKKTKILNDIKLELSKISSVEGVKSVVKLIDKNINDEEDWEFFEAAFNHADKKFFKKVKKRHPNLTHNDLRLCAYLRLNLSSKEIAPLLNISPRSVDIKRYRLRKKINLEREEGLNDYFINL